MDFPSDLRAHKRLENTLRCGRVALGTARSQFQPGLRVHPGSGNAGLFSLISLISLGWDLAIPFGALDESFSHNWDQKWPKKKKKTGFCSQNSKMQIK